MSPGPKTGARFAGFDPPAERIREMGAKRSR